MSYGAQRWKRIDALADEFAHYWKTYIYQIGTDKEKWLFPQRNAQVGDTVLLAEKNTPPRLDHRNDHLNHQRQGRLSP